MEKHLGKEYANRVQREAFLKDNCEKVENKGYIDMIKSCSTCAYRIERFDRIFCTYGSIRENPEVEKNGLCSKWKSVTQYL